MSNLIYGEANFRISDVKSHIGKAKFEDKNV